MFSDKRIRLNKKLMVSVVIVVLLICEIFLCIACTFVSDKDAKGIKYEVCEEQVPAYLQDNRENVSDSLHLYAKNAVLIDGETGDILYGKNQGESRPNASTTKILTCILALECGDESDKVTVSSYASKQPEVRLGAREGECYSLEDMLYAMMLESYNDAAVIIAEHIGGSVAEFADMMNKKVREIGCRSTYFITPNGLDAEDETGIHGTSAEDLGRIMRYCVLVSPKKDDFLKITRTAAYTFADESGQRTFSCINHNAFLNMSPDALSGKTGFTCDAGYCYIGAARCDGHTYIWALLGCGWPGNKTYKWKDSRSLLGFAVENTSYIRLEMPMSSSVNVQFSSLSAKPGKIETKCSLDDNMISTTNKKNIYDNIRYEYKLLDCVCAPVHKGEVLGTLYVYVDGGVADAVPVTAAADISDINLIDEIIRIIKRYAL